MNVIERIKGQLASNPIMLYMKGTPDFPQCGFSSQVVQILDLCHADYGFVNILEDSELRESLKEFSQWPTYPQLYVNGELVGGCDIMTEMYKRGDLSGLLAKARQSA